MMSVFEKIREFISDPDIAIDLGTAKTRIYASGMGIIADEPSIAEISDENNDVGNVITYHRHPDTDMSKCYTITPLRGGVVVHKSAAISLLKPLFKRGHRFGLIRPRVLACAPTDSTEGERNALVESIVGAGASMVSVIPEPLAAAIGGKLDLYSPYARMVVDIGGGVTDTAVIRGGCIVASVATRIACSDIQSAVNRMLLQHYHFSPFPGETVRMIQDMVLFEVSQQDSMVRAAGINECGEEITMEIRIQDVIDASMPILMKIIDPICHILAELPDREYGELIENGICLTGGGAYIKCMDKLIETKTSFDVFSALDPAHSVIHGASQIVGIPDWWKIAYWPTTSTASLSYNDLLK